MFNISKDCDSTNYVQLVPMLHHTFGEEISPNIQAEPLLAQLEAVTPHPITVTKGKRPTTTSL